MKVDTGPTGIGQIDQKQTKNSRQAFDSGAMVGIRDSCGKGPDRQHKIQSKGVTQMMQRVCQGGTTRCGQTKEGQRDGNQRQDGAIQHAQSRGKC